MYALTSNALEDMLAACLGENVIYNRRRRCVSLATKGKGLST
jgi:hypothetical protein